MKHLVRAGALLLAVLVIVFVLPRVLPTPAALEPYGFYRGGNNAEEWVNQPMQYAEPLLCNECHQDKHGVWQKSRHSTVSCESCHGPGNAHIEGKASLVMDTSREFCGLCHDRLLSRPRGFPQVDLEEHGGQSACVTCHNPHDPRSGALPQIPHILEGRTDCLLCHKAGGIKPFPQGHEGRSQDTCLNCHKSK